MKSQQTFLNPGATKRRCTASNFHSKLSLLCRVCEAHRDSGRPPDDSALLFAEGKRRITTDSIDLKDLETKSDLRFCCCRSIPRDARMPWLKYQVWRQHFSLRETSECLLSCPGYSFSHCLLECLSGRCWSLEVSSSPPLDVTSCYKCINFVVPPFLFPELQSRVANFTVSFSVAWPWWVLSKTIGNAF